MGQFHLISRRPRCRICARCGRLQLLGIDEGLPYRVEPIPLTLDAEIKALMVGRITYGIHAGYVCHRTEGRMTLDVKYGRPPVLATHKCHIATNAVDVDSGWVGATLAMIQRATAEQKVNDDGDEESAEAEVDALFTISDLLNGRVVAEQNGPFPPF